MARYEFKLPDIGEGIAEAEVVAWHVGVGDTIAEDDPLCDMMTDKATVEMTAPRAGRVVEVAGQVGDLVPIGAVLAVFQTEDVPEDGPPPEVEGALLDPPVATGEPEHAVEAGKPSPLVGVQSSVRPPDENQNDRTGWERGRERSERPAASYSDERASSPSDRSPLPDPPPQGGRERVLASPAVRDRARNLGIDLADVRADGRIRHADLDAFLTYNRGYAPSALARADEQVRVVGLRRRIAENMAAAKRAIPHFTYVDELDVTKLEALRADLNATRGRRPKLTMLPLLIVALCKALPNFPMLNARYDDEGGVVTRHGAVHLGIATQTDAGLMVPVLRDAQARNLWQLASEIRRLADAARDGSAARDELSGSTITLTSLGPLGGIVSTPVINRPEVAIVGPNKVVERPVVRDGTIVVAKVMNLSVSCDHRVVDGHDAASFVAEMRRLIETPALLLVD